MFLSHGADVCGFAAADSFSCAEVGFKPSDVYEKCRSVIVFGVALPKSLFEVSPRIIYSHYNGMSTSVADKIAFDCSKLLEENFGCTALPLPCDGPYEYWIPEKLEGKGTVSMKYAAVMAGLGQMGKNRLLLNEKYGNRLTLGAVLCDLELEGDKPSESICQKTCHKCIDSCPAGAIGENGVDQSKCRPAAYGKTKKGCDTVECNLCRSVCPMKAGKTKE